MTVGGKLICLEGFTQEMTLLVIVCLLIPSVLAFTLAWRLRTKNRLLVALSRHDPMTGALTHTETILRCELEVERSMRTQQSFAVLELDIDHFKHVNDRHGHQVGDEVLSGLVACVKHNLRMIDLFGRIGGEEFLAILPETNAAGATETAERLRKALETHVYETTCGPLRGITVSIGVAVFDPKAEQHTKNSEARQSLFKRADDAMYQAKNSGRNRVVLWQP
jgi:diguanylate cyclase (GGDEF)-like protein